MCVCVCLGPSNDRQMAVVAAFLHAWSAYKKYAWGHDELKPVTKFWQEWMGIGLTIVDSIDTMYIMGLNHGICACDISLLCILYFWFLPLDAMLTHYMSHVSVCVSHARIVSI